MASQPPAGQRDDDPWGQEAVLDDLMACPAWQGWEPADDNQGEPDAGEMFPGASGLGDGAPGPQAPGFADAGRVVPGAPGGAPAAGSGLFPPGRGFSAGGAFDTARTGPVLAGRSDAAAGPGRDYAGLDDDQLIGVMVGWQKTEAWAAAGRLSAVAELICRRPAETSVPRRGSGNQTSPLPGDPAGPAAAVGSPRASGSPSASDSASAGSSASASASAAAGSGTGALPLSGGFGGMGVRPIPAGRTYTSGPATYPV